VGQGVAGIAANRVVASRLSRLRRAVGDVNVCPEERISQAAPLLGVTSSRLGHDPAWHRVACRFLARSVEQCRDRGATLLVAAGSAIEPWARRAAELFAVPLQVVAIEHGGPADVIVSGRQGGRLSRDAVLIALADRVDALYVRRGGTIERCLNDRIEQLQDASTRVAVGSLPTCAAAGLITRGAIGWYWPPPTAAAPRPIRVESAPLDTHDEWARTDGRWLVHCTRGGHGAWPGETQRQYRDRVLLADRYSASSGPLEALIHILRSGRLVASARATRQSHPVVCFSAVPLVELIQRRCFRAHLSRWDYEPYGIAIRLEAAQGIGIQPVIYGTPEQRVTLARADRFRFHPEGKANDWRSEREWRSPATVDLTQLGESDVRVFVRDANDLATLPNIRPWPVTVLGFND
jgi:hypothetical protein